jgi:peptidoglycan hydrolase CwlO-like protein
MENRHLSRWIDDLKSNFDNTIDSLISEIEGLERDRDKMLDKIDSLKEQIEELQEKK